MVIAEGLSRDLAKLALDELESVGVLAIMESCGFERYRIVAFGDPIAWIMHKEWPYAALTN